MSNRYRFDAENHLHLLDEKPLTGTSSVADVIAKPLTWWASGLAVKEFGCPDPKVLTLIKNRKATKEQIQELKNSATEFLGELKKMEADVYLKLIDRAYRAHSLTLKEKASEGTDLHAELERFVKNEMAGNQLMTEAYHERIHPFINWARKNVKKYLWSEIHCYSEKHWLGGISDLGIIDKDGKTAVIDFKSSKDAYMSQFWQCAGYGIQLQENGGFDPDGNQIMEPLQKIDYYAVVPFGAEDPTPRINVDVAGGQEAFLAEVLLYKKMPRN